MCSSLSLLNKGISRNHLPQMDIPSMSNNEVEYFEKDPELKSIIDLYANSSQNFKFEKIKDTKPAHEVCIIVKRIQKQLFMQSGLYLALFFLLSILSILLIKYSIIIFFLVTLSLSLVFATAMFFLLDSIVKNNSVFSCLYRSANKELKIVRDKLEVANKIQLFAEPNPEALYKNNKLKFAYKIIPADHISGDIFGIHHVNEEETLIWIGDVIGHGIDAGLIMVAIQSIIQTLIVKHYADTLKDLLLKLNSILCEVFDITLKDSYQTSFLLLRFVNNSIKFAGQHENIIHWSAKNKRFSIIDTSEYGINLGTLNKSSDVEKYIEYGIFEFLPGDSIILYSDGLTETANESDIQFGFERFVKTLGEEFLEENYDISYILERLISEIKIWHGPQKFTDDVTLIIMQNKG